MSLVSDILDWSEAELPAWQCDALRRLFEKGADLDELDYCELYALLKAAHGTECTGQAEPQPLSRDQVAIAEPDGQPLVLKSISGLSNVNRLPTDQTLSFAVDGITIIYGANASGKSGYARVLKRACRARDQAERVLPDASRDHAASSLPSATIAYSLQGTDRTFDWDVEKPPPAELSRLSVFDSRCARVYVSEEQDVAYLPYGLDVVQNLANLVLPELTCRLTTEIDAISVDKEPFDHLAGDTGVGRLMACLSGDTSQADIRDLALLSDEEKSRLDELRDALAEPDPGAKARELRLTGQRVKELSTRVDTAWSKVSAKTVEDLQSKTGAASAATELETAAAEVLRSGESLLPGTGEKLWRALFDAARRFSTEAAYPSREFPHTEPGALCPLCQQLLVHEAGERLDRFEAFVKEDVAEDARVKRAEVTAELLKLEKSPVDVVFEGALVDELAALESGLCDGVRAFGEYLEQRKAWLVGALDGGDWSDAPSDVANPRARLRSLAASLLCQARRHSDAADESTREHLETERDELDARRHLAACEQALCGLVKKMKTKEQLESCKVDLKTRRVSDKAKELASEAVTQSLQRAMQTEFAALGVGHVGVVLKDRTEKGRVWHRLVLDLPLSAKLEDVLSEGEQRAIALGSFLAELTLAGHRDGIVFDDPVSSLDHWRRRSVARRLAQEALNRQVVVFTHDTTFLGLLRDEIEIQGVSSSIQHLEWLDDRPGSVRDGLPWEHQGYKARVDALEKDQRRLERLPWPAYPNQDQRREMTHQYDMLRATIERVIQDVVFGGVVQRYRDWIRVDRLHEALGFEEPECGRLRQLHLRCCGVVDAHDPSSAKDEAVPTAADLGRDLQTLRDIIDTIKSKRQASTSS